MLKLYFRVCVMAFGVAGMPLAGGAMFAPCTLGRASSRPRASSAVFKTALHAQANMTPRLACVCLRARGRACVRVTCV